MKEEDLEARKISETNIYDLAEQFNTLEVEKEKNLKNPSSIIVNQCSLL